MYICLIYGIFIWYRVTCRVPSGRGAEGRARRAGRAASSAASSASSSVAEEADQEEQETQRWDVEQAFSHQGSGRMLFWFFADWCCWFFFAGEMEPKKSIQTSENEW